MTYQKYVYTLVYLYLCSVFDVISADQACDKSKCKGPIKYYEDLNCTPIFGSEDSCCAAKYNCDNLKGRSKDKCYFKGHVYEIGESLKPEHAKPCDAGCYCAEGWNGVATFLCAIVDCFLGPEPGCHLKHSHEKCCTGVQACPQNNTELAKCEVDGTTYYDGQRFTPKSEPTLSCICSEGYTGENVAPFCKSEDDPYLCGVELHRVADIYENCAPAFYNTQNPATDCSAFSRCQNPNDTVIDAPASTEVSDPDSTCAFGQLTMKIGDQLNIGTDYFTVCLKCVCEVPPLPTCQRLPDSECDVTAQQALIHY